MLLNRKSPFAPVVARDERVRVKYDLETLLQAGGHDLATDIREFSRRAREWAQFGLLTTAERRSQYQELALLMRQGTPAAEAVDQAFGVPLAQVAAEFEEGRWRREATFRLPAENGPWWMRFSRSWHRASRKRSSGAAASRIECIRGQGAPRAEVN